MQMDVPDDVLNFYYYTIACARNAPIPTSGPIYNAVISTKLRILSVLIEFEKKMQGRRSWEGILKHAVHHSITYILPQEDNKDCVVTGKQHCVCAGFVVHLAGLAPHSAITNII
jgi:hypothetical protein